MIKNRQDACSKKSEFYCGAGRMPTPKRFIENGARCQLLLTSCTILKKGQDARSTRDEFSRRTGILPVHKRLIENGARCQLLRTFLVDVF
jgi:hypothetical protein